MADENRIVRFGVFELDLQAGQLRKSGIRIKLQDQQSQILSILLERPGDVVTREELRKRLWPDGTYVDFDHSLNSSVNKLREALGDAASNARFIETVPRRGYRFIAPVERPQVMPAPASVAAPELPVNRASRSKVIVGAGAAVLLIAVVGLATRWPVTSPREAAPKVMPLTSDPGLELQPSFSPDGNYVAYAGGPGGLSHLDVYVKQVGSETVRQLSSHPAPDVSPKWSPDGRSIAFARFVGVRSPFEVSYLITPVLGAAERRFATGWLPRWTDRSAVLLDWFPDSENMVIVDSGAAGNRCALFGLNARTGERWGLTTPLAIGAGDLDPAVSPDGRRLVFTRHVTNTQTDIYVMDLNAELRPAGEPQALTSGAGSRSPMWTPDGREIVFASGPYHRKRLSRIRAAAGSQPQLLPFAAEGTFALSAAISKKWQLTYVTSRSDVDIWRTKLGTSRNGSTAFLHSTYFEQLPSYSPDGKRIAFASDRSGAQQIWVSDAEGANAYQMTFLTGNLEASWPRWSPDGQRLAFTVGRSVYVISVEGGPPTIRLKDVAAREAVADWSPDGKWIYFVSNRSGRDELWKVSADAREGDHATQVTQNGAGAPRASPDGKFIYFTKTSERAESGSVTGSVALWRVPAEGGPEVQAVDSVSTSGNFDVTRDGMYFIPPVDETGRAKLSLRDARTLSERALASLPGIPMWGLAVSPDGRWVLHSAAGSGESDLMLVENFR